MPPNLDDPRPPTPAHAMDKPMDKHYLTPLFSPTSIVVFAGPPEQRAQQTPLLFLLDYQKLLKVRHHWISSKKTCVP